jgi:hypothetical protein
MSESDEAILAAVKAHLSQLEGLLEAMNNDYEEGLYRFYHQSFKVYSLQAHTTRAAGFVRVIADEAGRQVDPWFEAIVADGTGIEFDASHNSEWPGYTRPQVEPFLHARYFVEMMVKYGREFGRGADPVAERLGGSPFSLRPAMIGPGRMGDSRRVWPVLSRRLIKVHALAALPINSSTCLQNAGGLISCPSHDLL